MKDAWAKQVGLIIGRWGFLGAEYLLEFVFSMNSTLAENSLYMYSKLVRKWFTKCEMKDVGANQIGMSIGRWGFVGTRNLFEFVFFIFHVLDAC